MKFIKINPTLRIAFGLSSLTSSMILLAAVMGAIPDQRLKVVESRRQLCESLALGFSTMASRADVQTMQLYFDNVVTRNDDLLTLGLRKASGEQILQVNDHFNTWQLADHAQSTDTEICIPVYSQEETWGTVEAQFKPISSSGLFAAFQRPDVLLVSILFPTSLAIFFLYLRIVLKHLNPSKVVPGRVREALDSLAEGLLVLDKDERIVLANQAFQETTGRSLDDLIGKKAAALSFVAQDKDLVLENAHHPWQSTLESGTKINGRLMKIERGQDLHNDKTFLVSCAPINDDSGINRGVIASFEDVSVLEKQKNELTEMVRQLGASTDEIKKQNRELEILATRDALTGAVNRRSFFQTFDQEFESAKQTGRPLAAIMVDIDHFKSINDNHGHAVGDTVLRQVSATLEANVRKTDTVCRYGGEEFSILLPATDIVEAANVAEGIRQKLAALRFTDLSITASFGVSDLRQSPIDPQELLEQADKCLYVAKRRGRNQVVRWDSIPETVEVEPQDTARETNQEETTSNIPFHAVTALISALACRDQDIANHSRRVADLCVAFAECLLPMKDCYVLEIAGLLHDIGKIGVPDSILQKTEPLTDAEWQVVRLQQKIGLELVSTSFKSEKLNQILEDHATSYDVGKRIPIGARILAIADAYDSMTHSRVMHAGMTQEQAVAELRRGAGKQFDPELVEHVVQTLKIRGDELSPNGIKISKSAALNIGLQIERLSAVLDDRDPNGINAIATQLEATALKYGANEIAEKANMISTVTTHDGELYEIIRCTNELLDLCRSSQHSLLATPVQL